MIPGGRGEAGSTGLESQALQVIARNNPVWGGKMPH